MSSAHLEFGPTSAATPTRTVGDRRRRGSAFTEAARQAGVIWAGLFALGLGFGVLVTSKGLPWWLAPVISGVVFAGSVEFLLIGLLAVGAPLGTIAMTTFLVNSRHLFYGLSYPLERIRSRLGRVYAMFALCDEAYALATTSSPRQLCGARLVWVHAGLHLSWTAGSFVGALTGRLVLADVKGLDFILTALFVVLTIEAFRDAPDRRTLALALGASGLALAFVPGSMVLVAMSAFTAALVVRHLLSRPSATAKECADA